MTHDQETPVSDLTTGRKSSALSILKYTLWGGLIGFLYHFVAMAVYLAAGYLHSRSDSPSPGSEMLSNLVLWHFTLSPTSEPNQLVFMGWMLSGFAGIVAGGTIGTIRWLLARIPGNRGNR